MASGVMDVAGTRQTVFPGLTHATDLRGRERDSDPLVVVPHCNLLASNSKNGQKVNHLQDVAKHYAFLFLGVAAQKDGKSAKKNKTPKSRKAYTFKNAQTRNATDHLKSYNTVSRRRVFACMSQKITADREERMSHPLQLSGGFDSFIQSARNSAKPVGNALS